MDRSEKNGSAPNGMALKVDVFVDESRSEVLSSRLRALTLPSDSCASRDSNRGRGSAQQDSSTSIAHVRNSGTFTSTRLRRLRRGIPVPPEVALTATTGGFGPRNRSGGAQGNLGRLGIRAPRRHRRSTGECAAR